MAIIGQILGWALLALAVLVVLSFVLDATWRLRSWAEPFFDIEEGAASSQLLVVFPGAFSRARFQLEPVVANLPRLATTVYVENVSERYSSMKTVWATVCEIRNLAILSRTQITQINLIGSSMGAAVAAKTGSGLRKAFPGVAINLIAIDGVGRPQDLRQPAWVFRLMGWLPFGPIWDRLGLLKILIRPSNEEPATEWAKHAKDGLRMVRSIPTAFWGDQMRELGRAVVTEEDLAGFDRVTYVSSVQDQTILHPEESVRYWRRIAPPSRFRLSIVEAGHTAYEVNPWVYAAAINKALA